MSRRMVGWSALATSITPTRRTTAALSLVALAALIAVTPQSASAQFGALKRLKNAISPDSAAKVEAAKQDSIALATKRAAGDTTPLEKSRLSRALGAAGVVEQVTGKSALGAVTGDDKNGKKGGFNPMDMAKSALTEKAKEKALSAVTPGAAGSTPGSIPGMPNVAELMKKQQAAAAAQSAATSHAGTAVPTTNPMLMMSESDAKALAAFQQEMMEVAMSASGGDVAAKARLDSWQAIVLKYQPEIEKLAPSASAGDVASIQRLQVIQVNIIKDWANTATKSTKLEKAVTPVKKGTP